MNYTAKDTDGEGRPMPRGEMCIRGNSIMSGYYNNPEKNKEVFDEEGWLHTGDIVAVLPETHAIKIIDRKKNIFKLQQGIYIASETIENAFIKSPLISQAFVYGDPFQSYLVAIIIPAKEAV